MVWSRLSSCPRFATASCKTLRNARVSSTRSPRLRPLSPSCRFRCATPQRLSLEAPLPTWFNLVPGEACKLRAQKRASVRWRPYHPTTSATSRARFWKPSTDLPPWDFPWKDSMVAAACQSAQIRSRPATKRAPLHISAGPSISAAGPQSLAAPAKGGQRARAVQWSGIRNGNFTRLLHLLGL